MSGSNSQPSVNLALKIVAERPFPLRISTAVITRNVSDIITTRHLVNERKLVICYILNWIELTPFLFPHNTRHDHKQNIRCHNGQRVLSGCNGFSRNLARGGTQWLPRSRKFDWQIKLCKFHTQNPHRKAQTLAGTLFWVCSLYSSRSLRCAGIGWDFSQTLPGKLIMLSVSIGLPSWDDHFAVERDAEEKKGGVKGGREKKVEGLDLHIV